MLKALLLATVCHGLLLGMPVMFGLKGGSAPAVTITNRETTANNDAPGAASSTSISCSIGAASAGRTVFALIHAHCNTATAITFSSPTIGGIAATIHIQKQDNSAAPNWGRAVAIISAVVPTGTTASVAFTVSTSCFAFSAATVSVSNLQSATAVSTASTTGSSSTLSWTRDGIILGVASTYSATASDIVTWGSPLTESYEYDAGYGFGNTAGSVAGSYNLPSSTLASQTVSITRGGTDAGATAWASFR